MAGAKASARTEADYGKNKDGGCKGYRKDGY
jgi:hypothetical protein